jgi:putative ABC transport system ATP-binding protein
MRASLIDLDRISRVYRLGENCITALDAISLRIAQGEFIAIMGPSGSGKSTFMNIVGCLDTPTAGTYRLDGRDVGRFSRDELAVIRNQKIGFVFQGFNLLARTPARENVELPMLYNGTPAGQRRHMALEALRVVGLEDRLDHHPNQLSGGQQQRLAIARAIVNRPSILMADEPTGNLDSATSQEIMRLFVQLNARSGITVILVTHEPDIAEFARRRIRFLDGRIVSDQQGDAHD